MKEEKVVIGIDAYNQTVTGVVTKALTNIATDSDHIPLVLIVESDNETDSIFRHNFNSIGSGRREGSSFTNDEST